MTISETKANILRLIRQIPVPKSQRERWLVFERTIDRYGNLLPHTEQDWLSRITADHFRV